MGFTNLNPNKNKYFAVPEELKGYKNWVCWQSYPDPKSHSRICQIFGYRLYVLKFTVFRC